MVDGDLDFALRSLELNTADYPDWTFLIGVDRFADGRDPVPQLDAYKRRYPFFDYVYYHDIPAHRLGVKSASDTLEDLFQRLLARGCTRFFQINDDISLTRYWLHYAEDAMNSIGNLGVVIPHDGIASIAEPAYFCGFYYFSLDYVRRFHPYKTAFRLEPRMSYFVDTEFCLRAAKLGRLKRSAQCGAMHLNYLWLPRCLPHAKRERSTNANCITDGRHFIRIMRDERIDPWKYVGMLREWTPLEILPEMEALRGIEERAA